MKEKREREKGIKRLNEKKIWGKDVKRRENKNGKEENDYKIRKNIYIRRKFEVDTWQKRWREIGQMNLIARVEKDMKKDRDRKTYVYQKAWEK